MIKLSSEGINPGDLATKGKFFVDIAKSINNELVERGILDLEPVEQRKRIELRNPRQPHDSYVLVEQEDGGTKSESRVPGRTLRVYKNQNSTILKIEVDIEHGVLMSSLDESTLTPISV